MVVLAVLKVYKINQKNSSQQDGFLRKVDSFRKGDAKVVCICKGLLGQTAPLFGDFTELLPAFLNPKGPRMQQRSEKLKNFVAAAVENRVNTPQHGKPPFDFTDRGTS